MLFDSRATDQMNSLNRMRQWVVEENRGYLRRAKKTKDALNAVCTTVSGANLHWPANGPDLNPIEQIWGMVRVSVSREQGNISEEVFVKAEAPCDAISMESVNGMAGNCSTHLRAALALRGEGLNNQFPYNNCLCQVLRRGRPLARWSH
jgi:hypothetical protein